MTELVDDEMAVETTHVGDGPLAGVVHGDDATASDEVFLAAAVTVDAEHDSIVRRRIVQEKR